MSNLDNLKYLKNPNIKSVHDSLAYLPEQILTSWQGVAKLKLTGLASKKLENIIVCGLGGSNLAPELISAVFSDQLAVPLVLVRDYNLPKFASQKSLVVLASYSGNTEEVLSAFTAARQAKATIFCLSAGGQLASRAKKNRLTSYQFSVATNPSGQPRYGLGLQLGALLSLFQKLKLIKLSNQQFLDLISSLSGLSQSLLPISRNNAAKKAAQRLAGRNIFVVASGILGANAKIIANQINESAKNLATPYLIPEINHHLMEGLSLPSKSRRELMVLFLVSGSYSDLIQKRFKVTAQVLNRQRVNFEFYQINSGSHLGDALATLCFGSWLSFYLAVLNGVNPAIVPFVDYFKKEMAKK